MGLGKTYSADYLIDSNGNTGVSGQVLISTATGIDWADGTAITGGPYLPLAGGTITGNVRFNDTFKAEFGSSADLQINHDATDSLINNGTGHLTIRNGANDKSIFLQADNGSGGNISYLTLDGSTTHAYFSNPGNVGIGTTSPSFQLSIENHATTTSTATLEIDGKRTNGTDGSVGEMIFSNNGDTFATVAGFRDGADNKGSLQFQTQDSAFATRMTISSEGNVGIGTTAPVQTLEIHDPDASGYTHFGIKGTGHKYVIGVGNDSVATVNDKLYFYDNDNSAFRAVLDTSGNFGIGTTSPSSKLQVSGDAYVTEQFGQGVAIANKIAAYGGEFRASGASAQIFFGRSGSSVGSGAIGADSTYVFRVWTTPGFGNPFVIKQDGNVGIGTTSPSQKLTVVGNTYVSSGLLLLDNNQDIRWGDAGERITGHNTNGLVFTTNNFETMRINSQGKVGIGTTDPGSLLQVGGLDDGSNYDITLGWNAVDSEAVGTKRSAITFKTAQTSVNTEDIYKWDIAMLAAPATVTGEEFGSDLAFLRSTRGSTATDATTMILTRTGNVGIGTTAPTGKLEIQRSQVTTQFDRDCFLRLHPTATTNSGGFTNIMFGTSTTNNYGVAIGGRKAGTGDTSSNNKPEFSVRILNDGITGTEVLNINTEGNATFAGKLDVVVSNVSVTPNADSSAVFRKNGHNYISILSGGTNEGGVIFGNSADAADGWIAYKHGTGAADQAFAFGTANGERMRITKGGNVGIGTTAPGAKLDINGIPWVNPADGVHSGWNFRQGGVFKGWVGYVDSNDVVNLSMDGSIANGINVNASHNVGIGTASPNAKLDVVGNTRLGSGTLHVSTDQTFGTGFTYSFRDAVGILNPNGTSAASATAVMSIGGMSNGYSLVTTGNVGIGTASPTHKLHVNGDMRLTGALRDSNNAKGSAGQVLSSTGSATDWIPLPATPTIYTPKVYNLNNSTNINSQGQKLVPDFGTLEIEGNTTVQQVSGSDTDFQVTDENTGIYEVTYAVFYKNTGNQRTPLGTYLTLNGTAVNGSLMVNYVRSNVAGGGNFSSCTNTFYVNVTDASHPMALCVRRADSSTAPSGISMVEPAGMAVKSTISFRRIS